MILSVMAFTFTMLEMLAVYNNFISNCQHEGVFFSVVIGGELSNNQIAGICYATVPG